MKILFTLLYTVYVFCGYSQPQKIDSCFGNNGFVVTKAGDSAELFDIASAIALQADGKILLSGTFSNKKAPELIRYMPDGNIDSSFGKNGIVTIDSLWYSIVENYKIILKTYVSAEIKSIIVQPDGSIIVGGNIDSYHPFLARLMPNGSWDMSFANAGRLADFNFGFPFSLTNVVLQPDGKILISGSIADPSLGGLLFYILAGNVVIRLNADGNFDASFANDGVVENKIPFNEKSKTEIENAAMCLQPDGKIITVGYQFGNEFRKVNYVLNRYNIDGTPDKTFGKNGTVITNTKDYENYVGNIVLQRDGKILLGGYSAPKRKKNMMTAVRYKANGKLDRRFGDNGKATVFVDRMERSCSAFILPDGKILLAGGVFTDSVYSKEDFVLCRINANGAIDPSFGTNGIAILAAKNVNVSYQNGMLQHNNEIILGGYSFYNDELTSVLARYSCE